MFIQRYNNDSRVFAALRVLTLLLRINIVVSEETSYYIAHKKVDCVGRTICRAGGRYVELFGAVAFAYIRNGYCESWRIVLETITFRQLERRETSQLCFNRLRLFFVSFGIRVV